MILMPDLLEKLISKKETISLFSNKFPMIGGKEVLEAMRVLFLINISCSK